MKEETCTWVKRNMKFLTISMACYFHSSTGDDYNRGSRKEKFYQLGEFSTNLEIMFGFLYYFFLMFIINVLNFFFRQSMVTLLTH